MTENFEQTTRQSDYSAPWLGLTFLLTAIGYSLPFLLYPAAHPLNGGMSGEILNLYFLVGWMGLAHFVFAYYGQARAMARQPQRIFPFLSVLVCGTLLLFLLRHWLGSMYFNFLMWIYFLPHFVRAEIHFTNTLEQKTSPESRGVYLFPAIAFAFFTFALFGPPWFVANRWYLILTAVGCLVVGLSLGLVKQLHVRQFSIYALLALFLLAEGLVWATYRQYMVFQFQQGLYVFHIALASFYHYLRSYDFAGRMGILRGEPVGRKYFLSVFLVNLLVMLFGFSVVHTGSANNPLFLVFDISYFTFWVGLHQFASDLFMWQKRLEVNKEVVLSEA
jgi:hypothetical protein